MTTPSQYMNVRETKIPFLLLLTVFYENIYVLLFSIGLSQQLVYYSHFLCIICSFAYILINDRKSVFSQPLIFYLIWVCYVLINSFIKGVDYWESPIYMFFSIFSSYVVLLICQYAFKRNERLLSMAIIISFFVYIIIAARHVGIGNLTIDERMDNEDVNANALGERAAILLFFLNAGYLRKRYGIFKLVLLSVIPIACVILSGSRTSFGMAALVYLPFLLPSKAAISQLWGRAFFFAIFYTVLVWIFDNSLLGERLLSTSSQSSGASLETGTFWDLFGDRGYQYYISIPVIAENFFTGIGLGNFLSRVSGAFVVLHSEYLIQLLECGLVGFVLYFYNYFYVIKNVVRKSVDDEERRLKYLCVCGVIAILFACFVTRVSYYTFFACILGFVLNYSNQNYDNTVHKL